MANILRPAFPAHGRQFLFADPRHLICDGDSLCIHTGSLDSFEGSSHSVTTRYKNPLGTARLFNPRVERVHKLQMDSRKRKPGGSYTTNGWFVTVRKC